MPIYDFRCDHCGHAFSAVQSFTDEPLDRCPNCGKRPRRLLSTPAILFRGTGWYSTDSRKGGGRTSGAEKSGGDKTAGERTAEEREGKADKGAGDRKPPTEGEAKPPPKGGAKPPQGEAAS